MYIIGKLMYQAAFWWHRWLNWDL